MSNDEYNGLAPGVFEPLPDEDKAIAFEPEEYKRRLTRVREEMAARKIDMMFVTAPDHVCYLHGFLASWYKAHSPMRYPQMYGTAVHVDHDRLIHFDNPSELPVLAKSSVCEDIRFLPSREAAPNLAFIVDQLAKEKWLNGTVAMEKWSYVPNPAISAMFEGAFLSQGCRVVDGSEIIRKVRLVKSDAEIACIEKAVEICDIGHRKLKDTIQPGITELELFGEVTNAMMAAGGEFPALIPIFNALPVRDGRAVSSGHAMAGRKVIKAGEVLKADLSGVYNRYHGNVLRGYFVGDPPDEMVKRHKLAAGVFDVIRTDIKAGMTVAEVNTRLKQYYEDVGLWGQPGWALGYELGLSLPPDWVGEFYFNVADEKYLDRVFHENMVTNFESLFNTWLIDTCVYEKDGTRILSTTPLEIIAAG
ncbi:MAG: Xaa-Pro peptidase family protein [Alphaproteobacteria bacterium]